MPFKKAFFIAGLLSVFLSSCSTLDKMKTDINDLKSDSYETKKAVSELKADVARLGTEVSGLRAKTESLFKEGSIGALKESQESLFSQIEALLKDMQALRGSLDEYRHAIDKSIEEKDKERALLKSRLDEMEKALSDFKDRLNLIEEREKAAGKFLMGQPVSEEKLYEEAYDLFNEKKYKEAREKFIAFLKSFSPEHKLSGNAQFWIAETYYAERSFEDAILAYDELLKKYKGNQKIPSAMLKQAGAFIEIGDKRAGQGILKELIEKHPGTEQARAAEKRLKDLGEKTPPDKAK